jgi:lipopolysaccharide transport protein LptA
MALSRPNSFAHRGGAHPGADTRFVPLALIAAAGLAWAAPAPAASLGKCTDKIEVVGDDLAGDLRKNFSELRNVTVTGCDAKIQARVARFTKLDFDDSRWTFEGAVRINMQSPQGSLSSDQAVVSFRNNQIERVTITGKPAEFQQKRTDSDAIAHGRAGQIVYELGAGTVNLTENAWVCDGSREMRSSKLEYDLGKQELRASSQPGGQRVRVTIDPRASSKDPKKVTSTPATGPIDCGSPPAWNSTAPDSGATAADKRSPAP